LLKSRLVLQDDFEWSLPCGSSDSDRSDAGAKLKYIGGVDISFLKEDPSTACAAVVVLDAESMEIVHEEFDVVRMQVPYIPGFLAFREVLHIVHLIYGKHSV
jgi:deoxyinosine 3'endonuclease (endonuclease V)